MSATQLCVFDDKTDSKSKLVKKAQCNMVVLSGLSRLFCEDFNLMLCCNLMTIHANWMCQTLTQGIGKIETFTKYKSALLINSSSQKTQEALLNVEITLMK